MHNVSCDIIKDILPLYVDEVVSEDTHNMVSKHLDQCEECHKKYDDMKANVSIPMDHNAKPLKNIKRAWNRKKIVLVCVTLVIAIFIMCCGLFAVEEFVYQEQIAYNGAVFTQTNSVLPTLPQDCEEVGYLMGISFWSTASPTIDFMGTNLDGKYGGCPIYQCSNDPNMIYLEDFRGFFIPFQFTEYIDR